MADFVVRKIPARLIGGLDAKARRRGVSRNALVLEVLHDAIFGRGRGSGPPSESPATANIVKFLIPFLDKIRIAPSRTETRERVIAEGLLCLADPLMDFFERVELDPCRETVKEFLRRFASDLRLRPMIIEMAARLTQMIQVAGTPEEERGPLGDTSALVQWIERNIGQSVFKVVEWGCLGRTSLTPRTKQILPTDLPGDVELFLGQARAQLIFWVVDSFSPTTGNPPNGAYHIGVCRCSRVFQKSRIDQKNCRKCR